MIAYEELEVKTGGRLDVVDITEDVRAAVTKSGVASGSVLVYSPHTTCCVLIAPAGAETIAQLERAMAKIAPPGEYYAHDDLDIRTQNVMEDEPPNAPAHLAHVFLGKTSESVPIVDGDIVVGPSQAVLFVELDTSRARRYCIQVVGR